MNILPDDIWRVIYGFDPTFRESYSRVMNEMAEFWKDYRFGITFRQRMYNHCENQTERRFMKTIMPILADMSTRNESDLFERYNQIDLAETKKQKLFLLIKMHTPSTFSFSHHVHILERLTSKN